jgi:phospho-N-acetylmuramoyl-pentapeptide-transferase
MGRFEQQVRHDMVSSIVGFGLVGLMDDYLKVIKKNPKGLRDGTNSAPRSILALAIGFAFYFDPNDIYGAKLSIPFFKKWLIDLGGFMSRSSSS